MGENYERYSVIDISVTLFGYEFSNIVENSILKKHLSFAKDYTKKLRDDNLGGKVE